MAKYGYDQARLEAELAQVEQVYEAHTWQQTQMSEAQAATQVRNEQAERLAAWMRDLAKVARVALQTQPALLIELGF